MFSHSQSYNSILAEQEQRRKEKAEKRGKRKSDEGAQESPDRKKKHTPKKKKEDDTPRRRISGQDVGGLLREVGISSNVDEYSEDEEIVMDEGSRSSQAKVPSAM